MSAPSETQIPSCISPDDRVVFFDGVCKMCAGWAKFIHKHDPGSKLKLATQQSPAGQAVRAWCGLPADELKTLIFVNKGRAHLKTAAVFRILLYLRFPWPVLSVFWLVPWFIRDLVYDFVAANRYRMFGKEESCMMPSPELKKRFLKDG